MYKTLDFFTLDPAEEMKVEIEEESDVMDLSKLTKLLEIRALAMVQLSTMKFQTEFINSGDSFEVWNKCLPHYLNNAAIYYGHLFMHNEAVKGHANMPNGKEKDFVAKLIVISAITIIKTDF